MSKTKAPAFQFYANDFMNETCFCSAFVSGLYVRMLCIQWTHGALPNDRDAVARACYTDRAEIDRAWPDLMQFFAPGPDGKLRNPRLESIRERQEAVSKARRSAVSARRDRTNEPTKASTNDVTKKVQRKVKEKEKIEVEEEGEEVSEPRGKKIAKPKTDSRDPDVQTVIDHLTAALQRHGRAAKLDPDRWPKGQDGNRIAAKRLPGMMAEWITTMQDNGKLPPGEADPMDSVCLLIDRTVADAFDGPNATKVSYFTKHFQRLAAKAVAKTETTPRNQTDEEYLRSVAQASARRAANLAAGIDAY